MILAFETKELRTICEDNDAARALMGDEIANVLRTRLADLRAANTIDDLLLGRRRLAGPRRKILELDVVTGAVMTLTPNHTRPRETVNGDVDWARVSRVRLLRIGGPE